MKIFLCCLLLAAMASAEPPRSRGARFDLQRRETGEREPTTPPPAEAPYPAAGWRPSKEFALPARQAPPATSYGTPLDSYAAPQSEYGAPTEASAAESTTTAEESSTAAEVESLKVKGLKQEQSSQQTAAVQSDEGAYYVLLPNSRLQRVDFKTENDLANMAYTARLRYRDENQAPIYVYTGGAAPAAAYALPQAAYTFQQTAAYTAAQTAPYSAPQTSAYSAPQTSAYSAPQPAAYSGPQTAAAYAVQQTAAFALPQTAAYVRYI